MLSGYPGAPGRSSMSQGSGGRAGGSQNCSSYMSLRRSTWAHPVVRLRRTPTPTPTPRAGVHRRQPRFCRQAGRRHLARRAPTTRAMTLRRWRTPRMRRRAKAGAPGWRSARRGAGGAPTNRSTTTDRRALTYQIWSWRCTN